MEDVFLKGLTQSQQTAAQHVDGPALVLAGPGSGKTMVVTRRVARLVNLGIAPWQILALTFTNKAANEMRQRIDTLLDQSSLNGSGLTVATFHSFCARLLRRYASHLGLRETFSIYASTDQREAAKQAVVRAGLDLSNWTPMSALNAISNAKNEMKDATDYAASAGDFYTRTIARIYAGYEDILKAAGAVDFDDLLLLTAKLLKSHVDVRQELQDRFQYVLIDEYQDTNHAQFVIAQALVEKHRNLFVVGDPDQSIYAWRGADIGNILEFTEHHSAAVTVELGQNFRSTGHIVEAAAGLISRNNSHLHKELYTELGPGERPQLIAAIDEESEARRVVDLFRSRHSEQGTPWSEMAVLYRVNALTRVLETAFREAQIPYVIARGTAFYERKEVKDALAYLRILANPDDDLALKRIINTPPRGIGATTLNRVEQFALDSGCSLLEGMQRVAQVTDVSARSRGAVKRFVDLLGKWRSLLVDEGQSSLLESLDLADLVEQVVRESGLYDLFRSARTEEDVQRLANLEELVSAAASFIRPQVVVWSPESAQGDDEEEDHGLVGMLGSFLESVALVSDQDLIDPELGAVTLMTLHAAKGLEFDTVAMVGVEQGLLPHIRASGDDNAMEEERRLCYVGMTRARKHLIMTRAQQRTVRGMRQQSSSSQFLEEIPSGSLDQEVIDDPWAQEYEPDIGRSLSQSSLSAGQRVVHPTFGRGRIRNVNHQHRGGKAIVEFDTGITRTLILEYANLRPIGSQ